VLKPSPLARRSAAVVAEALWEAGVPREVLRLVDIFEAELGHALITHPAVDRVVLAGSEQTARLFRSWRDDLPLLATTGGSNAVIVTPSADLDLAVADVVRSAFGHAGQRGSSASLVILVGSAATSQRLRRQLVDAVSTLRVGPPADPATTLGPLVAPARGRELAALTTLEPGQSWLIEPHALDDDGRLFTPGLRDGVAAGSDFHLSGHSAPVLGIMTADSLEEAVELQNASAYGLAAGIHSLDPHEVAVWLDTVEAGEAYVNRATTGAVVQRQPTGGWKRSAVGTGAQAGGPNHLLAFGSFAPVEAPPSDDLRLEGLSGPVASVIELAQSGIGFLEFDRVRRAALSDERAWQAGYGLVRDVADLQVQRNLLRYLPVAVTLRLAEGRPVGDVVRLIAAAARARSPITVSSAVPLPATLVARFASPSAPVVVSDVVIESDAAWLARARAGVITTPRVRLAGGSASALATAVGGSIDLAIYAGDVTTSGRVELLTFLREQSVSITAHRYGNPDAGMIGLPV
jgi:RHH-type proline utilization regulon transcriptional repressor/proline dehydrogenase/delta 1-pyrroline-5-carboxylate dehydrogenase